ncbi:GFA family protein [Rhodanobacter sp. L36]|uniref:GFA family protein n=1 Tax=Rhodanobacter sp. L36 TaxID=1747221 RepID=UPI00131E09A3|nr:GFA family protein [Rhodanobacter sp. L36]
MTTTRTASCRCGELTVTCRGEPARVSICHCLVCKRRSGSEFSWNATWAEADVDVHGDYRMYDRISEDNRTVSYKFCPRCGNTLVFALEARPGMLSIPAGAFADPGFPAPTVEVFGERRSAWCDLPSANLLQA